MDAKFNLADYEPVQDRIGTFYQKFHLGRIITELVSWDEKGIIFKASLFADPEGQENATPLSTGWAHEVPGAGYVNKTSALENCETSAIGRALANIGLHGDKRASREEMEKVQRGSAPQKAAPHKPVSVTEQITRCRNGLATLGVPAGDELENQLELIRRQCSGDPDRMLSHLMDMHAAGMKWDGTMLSVPLEV